MKDSRLFTKYVDEITFCNRTRRLFWLVISLFLFRPFALPIFNKWRVLLLRIFGAKIGKGSVVRSTAYIPCPWNLEMGVYSCIGPEVKLHLGRTKIGSKVTISQRSYLCSASHRINSFNLPFYSGTIEIRDFVWIGAESFIMVNVVIGEGAVIGAASAVFKDVQEWTVVGGNPAKFLKNRIIED